MAAPINQPSTTTQITQTGQTTTTTTAGSLGEHSVTTTGSGAAAQTSQTVTVVADHEMQEIASQDGSAVSFSAEHSFSTFPPETGSVGATAQSAQSAGLFSLSGRTQRRDSEISSSSDGSSISRTSSNASSGETSRAESSPDLGDLDSLSGSERAEGAEGPEGPGGLPESTIPHYDPTDKASILNFLKNPAVQQKMQTKGGHFVYVDEARSSFIFVRNGDWSTAESIKVSNAKTKENITKPADLEMCIAKFCVGYETIHSDWTGRVKPTMEERSGATGNYNHLMLSMKFKTAVVYGPWNAKESSSGYTPSAWRRGAKVETGPIWDDVGGLKGINWKTTPAPDFSFMNETPGGGAHSTSHTGPGTPVGATVVPNVNVNLGGIKVDLGGINLGGITTNVTTGEDKGTSRTSMKSTPADDTVSTTSTGSQSTIEEIITHVNDPGPGEDDNAIPGTNTPPPPGPPPNLSSSRLLTISNASLNQVLQNVRQHLNTAYDSNGNSVSDLNQDLGQVVKNSENGVNFPTVILPKTTGDTDPSGQATGGVTEGGGGTSGTTTGKGVPGGGSDNVVDNRGLLAKVRQHLNEVYPKATTSGPIISPLKNGATIGTIINPKGSSQSSEDLMVPYQPETVARYAKLMTQNGPSSTSTSNQTDTRSTDSTSSSSASRSTQQSSSSQGTGSTTSTPEGDDGSLHFAERVNVREESDSSGNIENRGGSRASTRSTTTNLSPGPEDELTGLLGKIRSHLDTAYKDGKPIHEGGGHIRNIIQGNTQSTGQSEGATPTPQPTIAKIVTSLRKANVSSSSVLPQPQVATTITPQARTASTSTTSIGTGTESTSTTSTGTGTGSVSTTSTGTETESTSTTSTGTGTGSVSTQSTGVGTPTTTTRSTGTSATTTTSSASTQTPQAPLPSGTRHVATISLVRNAAGRSIVLQQGGRSQSFPIPPSGTGTQNMGAQLWAAASQVASTLGQVVNQAATAGSQPSSRRSSPTSPRRK
ncbi:conserved hypothetical protein [Chlamydia pneumoniae LPCoLN]|uniref:type III secretion system actin-recruiting effector Tarp n=1 Tax=Chlamydia pneumoniae TaxID=83558 RepID=UPI0001BD9E29|nr:type III secretion system actin-recruiting effector Tarp [Chlamydia pneumoniae]ACZ33550.1 conserved hypothetical protein [Chlamydia pneumoniae LPCoLN]ETR80483.1 hemagglutinin protein [Chlamydia pneumoniae B21]